MAFRRVTFCLDFTMHSAPEINSLQDLKGKVVGVSGLGGSTDFATRLALSQAGLVPDKDAAIRGVGGVPETVAALRAKVVHAGAVIVCANCTRAGSQRAMTNVRISGHVSRTSQSRNIRTVS